MASSPDAGAFARLDRDRFFPVFRTLFAGGRLTQDQVAGIHRLIDAFLAYALILDRRHLAYILATSFHETGQRMQPVREGFAATDAAARAAVAKLYARGKISRNYALPNAKGCSFYGRGDVQLTHEANYATMGRLLGLDLVGNPDLALVSSVSARILIEGVTRGVSIKGDFTGRALEDFIVGERCDYVGARRTVNGTDKAEQIAGYARIAERALVAGGMPLIAARMPEVLGVSPADEKSNSSPISLTCKPLPERAPSPALAHSSKSQANLVQPAPSGGLSSAPSPAPITDPASAGGWFSTVLGRLRAAYPAKG